MEEVKETSSITCLTPNIDRAQNSDVLVAQPEKEISIPKKRKTTRGRQKLEMKKIEVESKRQVAFSKRRTGLFKKSAELSVLTGANIAAIVFSQAGKIYTFGPVDTLIDKYLRKIPVSLDVRSGVDVAEEEVMRPWWERPVESVPEEELESYVTAMRELRENLRLRIIEIVPAWPINWKPTMDINQSFENSTYGSRSRVGQNG